MNESNLEQKLQQDQSSGQLEQFQNQQDQSQVNNQIDKIFKMSDKFDFYTKIKDQSFRSWTPLLNKFCESKQLKMKFAEIAKVNIYLNNDEKSSYVYSYNANGSSLFVKNEEQQIEVAKIENEQIYLLRDTGKYEKIGQIFNQAQCKKIKVIAWGLMPNSVFQTESNKFINFQVIPCCFPFYKIIQYFQKDEVIVKDKNTDKIYSTYSTKSLKKQKQSIFSFTENPQNNVDKMLSFVVAMQYIEIIWFNKYSQYFQK